MFIDAVSGRYGHNDRFKCLQEEGSRGFWDHIARSLTKRRERLHCMIPRIAAQQIYSMMKPRAFSITSSVHYNDVIMGPDSVSNYQLHDCLLNRLCRRRSKKTSTLRVTGLCAGNSPGTGEFTAQMASYAEKVSIWWRHHDIGFWCTETWCPINNRYKLMPGRKSVIIFVWCNLSPIP